MTLLPFSPFPPLQPPPAPTRPSSRPVPVVSRGTWTPRCDRCGAGCPTPGDPVYPGTGPLRSGNTISDPLPSRGTICTIPSSATSRRSFLPFRQNISPTSCLGTTNTFTRSFDAHLSPLWCVPPPTPPAHSRSPSGTWESGSGVDLCCRPSPYEPVTTRVHDLHEQGRVTQGPRLVSSR